MSLEEEEEDTGDPNAWIATFGDLITLLMTFFVLMLSFSSLNTEKFSAILDSIGSASGSTARLKLLENDGVLEMVNPLAVTAVIDGADIPPYLDPMGRIYEEVVEYMTQSKFAQFLEIKKTEQGFVIKIASDTFFDAGKSQLKEEHLALLDKLIGLVRLFPNKLSIDGHIDKSFTPTDEFPSSMDLSIARAVSTCQYFLKQGIAPERLGISGYGSYRPQASQDSVHDERIEITIFNVRENG
ncbi:MAG: OmpA/MotB family protein [Candidatus Brocadiales bacterium]